MKNERCRAERAEIIKNCPLGAEAVFTAFERYSGEIDYLVDEEPLFRVCDPDSASYLLDESENWPEFRDKEMFKVGVLLARGVFREKMGSLIFQNLNRQFIDRHNQNTRQSIKNAYSEEDYFNRMSTDNVTRKNLFIRVEQEAYRALSDKLLGDSDDKSLFEDPIFDGFVFGYFYFRSGFGNPGNYGWDLLSQGASLQTIAA
jgi:hypothetical protein